MAFHYSRASWTQHTLVAGLLGSAVAIGATPGFASLWASLVASWSDRVLFTGGLLVIHTVLFWSVCAAFHMVDTTDRPAFIARYRIQTDKRRHPDLPTTLRVLARNQVLFLPILLLGTGELLILRGWTAEAALPSLPRLALELGAQALIAPIVFYATHRLLHGKWWMRHVHRVHHEFRTTTAWASEYAHPVEFAAGNFLTMVLGALIIAPHLASIYLFAALGLLTILVHHSGYALPWASSAVPHDWHHYRMKELFGTTGFWDRVFGTDAELRTLEDGDVR